MADNPDVNTGSAAPGAVNVKVAADEIAGVVHQRVKVEFGADGTATEVSAADPLPVTGPLTDAQLRAAAVPVSGSVNIGSGSVSISGSVSVTGPLTDAQLRAGAVPVSAASLPLPSGASTSALQASGNASLTSIDGKVPALGQTTMAGSQPVTIASNQTAIPVSDNGGSLTVDAVSLPLPTGAATSALQTTGNTSLGNIDTKTPSLVSGRVPVDGSGVTQPVSGPLTDAQLRATAVPVSDGGGSITVDGTVAVSGSVAVTGPLTDAQLRASAVPVSGISANLTGTPSAYQPGYDDLTAGTGLFNIDPAGNLVTRSQILTDEGTFRVNFANTSLSVAVGSPTRSGDVFTGGSLGSAGLDLHVGDYLKYDADPESAWCQVIALNGATATVDGYTGAATSGAASRAPVAPFTGTGGSMTVASGQLTLTSGTTSGSETGILRSIDFAPLIWRERFSISARVTNQDFHSGLAERLTGARWFARFRFTGTTNTLVICETGRNPTGAPSAPETESTTATFPAGSTSAGLNDYRVELLTERVIFYINSVKVAEHFKTVPSQHDEMVGISYWDNTGVPVSSNAVIDYITVKNHNKAEIGVFSDTESIEAAIPRHIAFPYSVAGVITINTDLIKIDCSKFASLSIQCTSMGTTGVVTPQWSNDPTFATVGTATILTQAGATATTFNAAGFWTTPVVGQYLRLRLTTATTAGTTTLMVRGMATAVQMWQATQPVSGTVTANLGTGGTGATAIGKAEDAVAASGDTGVAIWGVRRDALTTSSSAAADYNELAVNRFGAQYITDFRLLARSYRAVTAAFTVAGSATDIWDIFGNGTSTVVVNRLRITGTQTTGGNADIRVRLRTTANSAGTRVASTVVKLEQADAAANSTPGHYTANPTTGTDGGALDGGALFVHAPANGSLLLDCQFGDKGKGVVLSGTAQGLVVNLGATTPAGIALGILCEWYEF
jgi:hypothetical protein